VSFRSLEPKIGLSINTLEKFSGYLGSAMLVFFVGRFGWSFGARNRSPRKVYSVDPGLSNAVGPRFSENTGSLAENIVALEPLRRKSVAPSMEIFCWRDESGRERNPGLSGS
jgi:predicted AAA+ superfamily ATPase